MNKHLFGISTYFLTFLVSVLLVVLFGVREKPAVETYALPATAPLGRTYEAVEQREVKKLLDNDRRFGLEYYRRAGQPTAANALVEKMRRLGENPQLPTAVREAYENHLAAWDNYAKHLSGKSHLAQSDNLCSKYDSEISGTYDELLETARDFGVDLPY